MPGEGCGQPCGRVDGPRGAFEGLAAPRSAARLEAKNDAKLMETWLARASGIAERLREELGLRSEPPNSHSTALPTGASPRCSGACSALVAC